jgi:hypothetical protein
MSTRAEPSGLALTAADAALIRGMIVRGDRHHDIAAFFGVNQGRIAEIKDGSRFPGISAADADELPQAVASRQAFSSPHSRRAAPIPRRSFTTRRAKT